MPPYEITKKACERFRKYFDGVRKIEHDKSVYFRASWLHLPLRKGLEKAGIIQQADNGGRLRRCGVAIPNTRASNVAMYYTVDLALLESIEQSSEEES